MGGGNDSAFLQKGRFDPESSAFTHIQQQTSVLKAKDMTMTANEKIFVGWKEIMPAFGVRSKRTMKRKIRKYNIPFLTVAGKPTISADEVRQCRESRRREIPKRET